MRQEGTVEQEQVVGLKFLFREGSSPSAPLVVFVHGRAGNHGVMWTFERCVPRDAWIVALQAFEPDPLGGFSWWRMDGEAPESGIPLEQRILVAARRIGESVGRFREMFNLSPRRVLACGFSQGGAVLSSAVLSGELEVDGLAMLASFIPRAMLPAFHMHGAPAIFISHGTEDEVISIEKARQSRDRFLELGLQVEYCEEPVRHKVGTAGMRALTEWVGLVVD